MKYTLYKIILADYINPQNDELAILIREGAIVLKRYFLKNKCVYRIEELGKECHILLKYRKKRSIEIIDMKGKIGMPSFFDMHFHWVQDDVRLMPKTSLLNWLKKYTWPYEAKFKNISYSKKKAKEFSYKLLKNGTLGGAVYSSIHGHSVDHALLNFQGEFIVGNVIMTNNGPENLLLSEKKSLSIIKNKIKKFKKNYALTPRFAITVGPKLMKEIANEAKKNNIFIQTHLSETNEEIKTVLNLFRELSGFENISNYTDVYNRCSLLGNKSIFGHGIYLSENELKILSKAKAHIAHCPTSNAPIKEKGLGSGLFDFKKAEKFNVSWALASDIGGGPYLSMLDVMRSFVQQNIRKKILGATYVKALYRSTLKGAEILDVQNTQGNLNKSKFANIIFLNAPKKTSNETVESVLKSIIENSEKNRTSYEEVVTNTFYKGKEVYSKNS